MHLSCKGLPNLSNLHTHVTHAVVQQVAVRFYSLFVDYLLQHVEDKGACERSMTEFLQISMILHTVTSPRPEQRAASWVFNSAAMIPAECTGPLFNTLFITQQKFEKKSSKHNVTPVVRYVTLKSTSSFCVLITHLLFITV